MRLISCFLSSFSRQLDARFDCSRVLLRACLIHQLLQLSPADNAFGCSCWSLLLLLLLLGQTLTATRRLRAADGGRRGRRGSRSVPCSEVPGGSPTTEQRLDASQNSSMQPASLESYPFPESGHPATAVAVFAGESLDLIECGASSAMQSTLMKSSIGGVVAAEQLATLSFNGAVRRSNKRTGLPGRRRIRRADALKSATKRRIRFH
jgi:hypothetical protein